MRARFAPARPTFLVTLIKLWASALPALTITFGLILGSAGVARAESGAASLLGLCDYYPALHTEMGCGPDSYLILFGEHYCRQFDRVREAFSAEGLAAVEEIKLCLQKAIETTPGVTCDNVKQVSVDSHIHCYESARFCAMSTSDKAVLAKVVLPSVTDRTLFRAIRKILRSCMN